jgi:hypothetical protein
MMSLVLAACMQWALWAHWDGSPVRPPGGGLLTPGLNHYEVVETYDSRAACELARRRAVLNPGRDRTVCLPDTMDPRGPRG